jgi:hypothetical protein
MGHRWSSFSAAGDGRWRKEEYFVEEEIREVLRRRRNYFVEKVQYM